MPLLAVALERAQAVTRLLLFSCSFAPERARRSSVACPEIIQNLRLAGLITALAESKHSCVRP